MSRTPRAPSVAVVMPVLDERDGLPRVLADIPDAYRQRVVVVDNGSRDGSGEVARTLGAVVVREPRRGYGSACLAGIAACGDAEIVVFLDADHSDDPRQMPRLVAPIAEGRADLVIGSRQRGVREPGALPLHARLGNRLAVGLIRAIWGARFTDLGPFRAIRRSALASLGMRDRGYGWTVEMQVRAARLGMRTLEVPVDYRRRVGRSKITGTVRGTLLAGSKILGTIARHALQRGAPSSRHPSGAGELISVIVPTLDEAEALPRCLEALERLEGPLEVIVVDGGSRDDTVSRARTRPGVRVLESGRGRAEQLAAGVRESRGRIVWMLHADCMPQPGAARAIRDALADADVAIGAFRFALDDERPAFRLIERGVAMRSRMLRAPYGDQGLFVRRDDLDAAGGIPRLPILEDLELVRAMRRRGRLLLVDLPLITSARRWREGGLVATTGRHMAVLLLARLGVPPRRLLRLRRRRVDSPGPLGAGRATGRGPRPP